MKKFVFAAIVMVYLFCGIVIYRIHDKLCKVLTANLWRIGGVETGGTLTNKRGYGCYLRVALQNVGHRICHLCGSCSGGSQNHPSSCVRLFPSSQCRFPVAFQWIGARICCRCS